MEEPESTEAFGQCKPCSSGFQKGETKALPCRFKHLAFVCYIWHFLESGLYERCSNNVIYQFDPQSKIASALHQKVRCQGQASQAWHGVSALLLETWAWKQGGSGELSQAFLFWISFPNHCTNLLWSIVTFTFHTNTGRTDQKLIKFKKKIHVTSVGATFSNKLMLLNVIGSQPRDSLSSYLHIIETLKGWTICCT